MKKALAVLLVMVMAISLSACGSSNTATSVAGSTASASAAATTVSGKTTPDDTLVYATNGEPGNLDPQNNPYLMGQIIIASALLVLRVHNATSSEKIISR